MDCGLVCDSAAFVVPEIDMFLKSPQETNLCAEREEEFPSVYISGVCGSLFSPVSYPLCPGNILPVKEMWPHLEVSLEHFRHGLGMPKWLPQVPVYLILISRAVTMDLEF